jgi:hypothetical protein
MYRKVISLLEFRIREDTDKPFEIWWNKRTELPEEAIHKQEERNRLIFGGECPVIEGYRVPVVLKAEVTQVVYYRALCFQFPNQFGWEIIPEQHLRNS